MFFNDNPRIAVFDALRYNFAAHPLAGMGGLVVRPIWIHALMVFVLLTGCENEATHVPLETPDAVPTQVPAALRSEVRDELPMLFSEYFRSPQKYNEIVLLDGELDEVIQPYKFRLQFDTLLAGGSTSLTTTRCQNSDRAEITFEIDGETLDFNRKTRVSAGEHTLRVRVRNRGLCERLSAAFSLLRSRAPELEILE